MASRGKHKHSLSAGSALRQLIDMTTIMSPTQGGFHKPKVVPGGAQQQQRGQHIDGAVDNTLAICAGFESHIVRIYRELCAGQATLSRERFERFLREIQGEDLAGRPLERESFTLQQFFEVWSYSYRLKPLRPVDPEKKDLSKPISHYFISSSHNTYLLGNQITSNSSVEAYSTALGQDCRCIEIDVWNGVNPGLRTPNRSRSPRPGHHARHMSTSSVATAVEGGIETLRHIISGKSSHSRSPSASRQNLEVPSPRGSQLALPPGGDVSDVPDACAVSDRLEQLSAPSEHQRSRSRSRARSLTHPNAVEPVVMHAHTYGQRDISLGGAVKFRDVCRVIGKTAFAHNHLPIIVSLEVHADTAQQDVMVDIMKEEWGDMLLDEAFINCDPRLRLPKLGELTDKILIKVKKASVIANSNGTAHSLGIPLQALKKEQASSSDEDSSSARRPRISKRLSSLAVYTHSKHFGGFQDRVAKSPSHIFSLSEASVRKWYKDDPEGMTAHNKSFLMRAYPDPVARVDSGNMDPSSCWRKGVQMVAMNWQTMDSGMMINHAMFADEAGWALKPAGIRAVGGGGLGVGGGEDLVSSGGGGCAGTSLVARTIALFKLTVLAGQNVPPTKGKSASSFDPTVNVYLHVEGRQDPLKGSMPEGKTSQPDWGSEGSSVCFKDVQNVVEEFSFLKLKIEDDGTLSSWACYRLDRLRQGYRFLELMGPRGERTEGRLFVKIEKVMK